MFNDKNLFEYDLIIKFNSFRDLDTKEGWKIEYGTKGKEKFFKSIKEDCIIVGVTGNKNRGKSLLLNRITGYNIPSGYLYTTKGISSNFPNLKENNGKEKNIITLDTAGKEIPLLETSNEIEKKKVEKKLKKKKEEEEIRYLSRDQLICEEILADFIMDKSSVLITVIEQLSYVEQIMLTGLIERLKVKKKKKNKKLFVIHNLNNLTTREEIDKFIKEIIFNSLTFELEEKKYDRFKKKGQAKEENLFYYQEKNDLVDIFHIIMGNDNDEKIRKFYNEPAINHIISEIVIAERKKFNLIEEFTEHIKKKSKSYLEEGSLEELKYDEIKIYIEKPREIKLKEINSNENGFCNFYSSTIQPPYSEKIFKENGNFYLEIETELFGNVNFNDTQIENNQNDFLITISGKLSPDDDIKYYNMEGNLKYNDFSLRILINKKIQNNELNQCLIISEVNEEKEKKIEDKKFGIYNIFFKLTAKEHNENHDLNRIQFDL